MDYTNSEDPDFSSRLSHLAELEQYLGFPFCKSETIDSASCQIGIGTLLCPCSTSIFRSLSVEPSNDFSPINHYASLCSLNSSPFPSQPASFLYTLIAPTSAASRLIEENITFLNQGQSYELKLKKISNNYNNIIFESVIRITFHERRLQYSEKEQFENWIANRKDEQMIEFDLPLLYNALKSECMTEIPNAVCVRWLGHEEATVGLKINCISTEFTAKKHGGEKGVPLRMQIETYATEDRETNVSEEFKSNKWKKLLHSAYCLVKIFKPNGADRKNKNDLQKIAKMTPEERASYQPTYENTIFKDMKLDILKTIPNFIHEHSERICHSVRSLQKPIAPYSSEKTNNVDDSVGEFVNLENGEKFIRFTEQVKEPVRRIPSLYSSKLLPLNYESQISHDPLQINTIKSSIQFSRIHNDMPTNGCRKLTLENTSTVSETLEWLRANNFDEFLEVLRNYSGADLFRLSRKDLTDICGLSDGIRLHNAIKSKKSLPRLTIFVQIRSKIPLVKTLSTDSIESCSSTDVSSTVTNSNRFQKPIMISNISPVSNTLKNAQSLPELKLESEQLQAEKNVTTKRRKLDINNNYSESFPTQQDPINIFHPVYLNSANLSQLSEKLACICQIQLMNVLNLFYKDNKGFIVLLNNEFVENIEDRSCFIVDVIAENSRFDEVNLLLQSFD